MTFLSLTAGRKRSSRGQALPIGLFFMFLGLGLLYFMFNAGQVIGEKVRVTNAADMAAYSVGVQEARALNYDAYINRAIVANEIAIAQMLSLQSWVHYFDSAIQSSGAVESYVSTYICGTGAGDCFDAQVYAGALAGTAWGDAYTGGQASDKVVTATDWTSVGIVSAHNIAAFALSASQQAVYLTLAVGAAQWNLANDVVKAMDPKMDAQIVPTSYDYADFTKAYAKNGGGSDDERGRLADVIMRSRDPFTANRSFTFEGNGIPLVLRDPALKKRGGTDLIGYDQWKAMDTLEGHAEWFGCGKWHTKWCDDIGWAMAAGGARAVNGQSGGGSGGGKFGGIFGAPREGYLGGSYDENSEAASWGDRDMVTITDRGAQFYGLPTTRDLSNLAPSASGRTGITVLVMKSGDDVRATSGSALTKPAGQLNMFDGKPAGNRLASLSRAEVFFERPVKRGDGRVERPSLYNPYWAVHLVAPTAGDKAYAALHQGGKLNP